MFGNTRYAILQRKTMKKLKLFGAFKNLIFWVNAPPPLQTPSTEGKYYWFIMAKKLVQEIAERIFFPNSKTIDSKFRRVERTYMYLYRSNFKNTLKTCSRG